VRCLAVIVAGCLGLWPAWHSQAQDRSSVAVGVEYTSGDYGADADTDILYVPVTVSLGSGANLYWLTVPYIRVTAPTGGVVVGTDHMGRPIRRGTQLTRTTESGLGDIEAGYGRTLVDDFDRGVRLDAVAKVKFGTADDTRGLGTGENDYSIQLDAYRYSGSTTWLGTLGYRVLGDPPGTNFDNIGYAVLGAWTRFAAGYSVGFAYDYRQAATAAGDPRKELIVFVRSELRGDRDLRLYVIKGSGDASPDYGLGLLYTWRY